MADNDTAARFDRWAATYDRSALQPLLYAPVQQAALRLAADHCPTPRRVLDVGCGTGALLRQATQRFPQARLVGIDPALRMATAASEATPAGIAQIRRVLSAGGVLTLADDFASRAGRTVRSASRLRRARINLPADVDAMLASNQLTVVGWRHLPGLPPACRVVVVAACTPGEHGPSPSARIRAAAGRGTAPPGSAAPATRRGVAQRPDASPAATAVRAAPWSA